MFPGTPCGPVFRCFWVFPGGGTADPCFSAKNPPKRRCSPPPEPSVRGPTEAPHKASQSAGRRGAPPVPSRAQSAFGVHISNTQIFIGSPPGGGPKKIFDPGQKIDPPPAGGGLRPTLAGSAPPYARSACCAPCGAPAVPRTCALGLLFAQEGESVKHCPRALRVVGWAG